MKPNLQPILSNHLVSLRPLQEDDFCELYQVASDPLIWEQHPNPDLTFNFITNLKVPQAKLERIMQRLGRMVEQNKLQRVQISSSLDGWGPQQEYVRWGLDLNEWTENWEYLLDKDWVIMCVNSALASFVVAYVRASKLISKLRIS